MSHYQHGFFVLQKEGAFMFVMRKPEPLGNFSLVCCCLPSKLTSFLFLGTEFKNIACRVLRIPLFILIQREKEALKTKYYNASIGTALGCMLH